jgi:hypothetical protein
MPIILPKSDAAARVVFNHDRDLGNTPFTVANKPIERATLHASALGLLDVHCNGQLVGDAYFQPGWSDYAKRAYYRTHDVIPNSLSF